MAKILQCTTIFVLFFYVVTVLGSAESTGKDRKWYNCFFRKKNKENETDFYYYKCNSNQHLPISGEREQNIPYLHGDVIRKQEFMAPDSIPVEIDKKKRGGIHTQTFTSRELKSIRTTTAEIHDNRPSTSTHNNEQYKVNDRTFTRKKVQTTTAEIHNNRPSTSTHNNEQYKVNDRTFTRKKVQTTTAEIHDKRPRISNYNSKRDRTVTREKLKSIGKVEINNDNLTTPELVTGEIKSPTKNQCTKRKRSPNRFVNNEQQNFTEKSVSRRTKNHSTSDISHQKNIRKRFISGHQHGVLQKQKTHTNYENVEEKSSRQINLEKETYEVDSIDNGETTYSLPYDQNIRKIKQREEEGLGKIEVKEIKHSMITIIKDRIAKKKYDCFLPKNKKGEGLSIPIIIEETLVLANWILSACDFIIRNYDLSNIQSFEPIKGIVKNLEKEYYWDFLSEIQLSDMFKSRIEVNVSNKKESNPSFSCYFELYNFSLQLKGLIDCINVLQESKITPNSDHNTICAWTILGKLNKLSETWFHLCEFSKEKVL